MLKRTLDLRDLELLREVSHRELITIFIERVEVRLFNEFKTGTVEERRHTGYALDALAALGLEIQSGINEAIRDAGRSEQRSEQRSAAGS